MIGYFGICINNSNVVKKEINGDLFVLVIYIPTEAYKRVDGKILLIVCTLFPSQLSITDGNNSCLQDVIVIRDR